MSLYQQFAGSSFKSFQREIIHKELPCFIVKTLSWKMRHTLYIADLFQIVVAYFKMKWFHEELILAFTLFFWRLWISTYKSFFLSFYLTMLRKLTLRFKIFSDRNTISVLRPNCFSFITLFLYFYVAFFIWHHQQKHRYLIVHWRWPSVSVGSPLNLKILSCWRFSFFCS